MPAEKDIQAAANEAYASRFDAETQALIETASGSGRYEDYEDALEQLQEQPLSFDKLITDHRRETIDWEILLGTGGPADRVIVRTDFDGNIETAWYEFQDWFQPWTRAEDQDENLVIRYAEIVGYYEPQS